MFLGSYGVGKTTILLSYINNKFIPNSQSTIGIDHYSKKISSTLTIKVQLNLIFSSGIHVDKSNIILLTLLLSKGQME